MSEIPGDLKFLKSHEWARVEGDGRITVGISDHAQGLLGDLVYVELPTLGDRVEAGTGCAVVESVKAASDVYSPVTGKVVDSSGAESRQGSSAHQQLEPFPFPCSVRRCGRLVHSGPHPLPDLSVAA